MRKQDLRSGMIVELRTEKRFIVVGENLVSKDSYYPKSHLTDDLRENTFITALDIMYVYEPINNSMDYILNCSKAELKLLWKRNDIDWTKVPFGTKVRVWDEDKEQAVEGLFLEYLPKSHLFRVYSKHLAYNWRNCELIAEGEF